jgi:hypothetical protein
VRVDLRISSLLVSLVLSGLAPGGAGAATLEYGLSAGPASPLWPNDTLGASIGASSLLVLGDPDDLRLTRVRGELLGVLSSDAKAIMPTLSGEIGVRILGGLELHLSGGVQIFGFASRAGTTIFAGLGFVGGGGLSARLGRRLRLSVRGVLTWLPSFAAGTMSAPEGQQGQPTFGFLSVLIGLEYRSASRKARVDGDLYEW